MKKTLVLLSSTLLAAGCAHRSYTYSDTYSGGTVYENDAMNSKGAGARALKGETEASEPYATAPVIVVERAAPIVEVAPGDSEAFNSKGAGARALIRGAGGAEPEQGVIVSEPNTVEQGAGARSLTGTSETGNIANSESFQDATFVREAAQSGLAEVRMGQLAQQNAESQAVKSFGERLVNDHSKANEELTRLATQKGLNVPTLMSTRDEQMLQHLSSLSGAEFDRACQKHAVEAHNKAVRTFKQAAKQSQDPEIQAFAQKTLPTLEEHLVMAKELPR